MSKSEGNFLILDNLIQEGFNPLDYRLLLLGGHYRSQIKFSWASLETAKSSRKSLMAKIQKIVGECDKADVEKILHSEPLTYEAALQQFSNETARNLVTDFAEAIMQDISTPKALSVLNAALKEKTLSASDCVRLIKIFDEVLGLKLLERQIQPEPEKTEANARIDAMVAKRSEAKKNKNFELADKIREELNAMGIVLEDSPTGTTWKKR